MRLLRRLSEKQILLVPVGELERFVTSVGGHGPAWVAQVLEQGLHCKPSDEARKFVVRIRQAAEAGLEKVQTLPASSTDNE